MTPSLVSSLLICAACMTGIIVSLHTGQEFMTAFLQNSNTSSTDAHLQLIITAFNALTSVTVSLNNRNLSWSLRLYNGESHTISLPTDIEMTGTGFFDSSVLITSNHDITVMALNSKTHSSSRILVLPVDQLDNDYYIVTPNQGPVHNLKEFAVINYDLPSKVHIYVKGWAMFNGINYTSSHPLTIDLSPFQIFQLQSTSDLSGTRVLSNNLVAVLSGDSCSWKNGRCGHIYEQLFPVSSWGKEYYVAPLPFQYSADIVYVTASQFTQVNYTSILKIDSMVILEGQVLSLHIRHNSPLAISANVSIQVMFYCTGGITEKFLFDPFFIYLPDTSKFCTKYQVHGLKDVINAVLITTKTSSIAGIKFNKLSLQNIQWRKIPGTQYSWTQYRYGRQLKSHIVSHSTSMFSVLSVGISSQMSYGLSGVCFMSTDTCTNKQCRKKESCQIINGKPACIPDGEAICQIWGDPHYQTFDGLNYDSQGTCTYTVAQTCMKLRGGGDPTLPEFSIEAKNDYQVYRQSSYIAMVSVHIYEYNITMVRSDFGFVRVNNIRWTLPMLLDDGRILITPIGFHVLIETSFIRIRYDWNVFLFIKIPSSFFENVCGLCGNYNGNKDDDLEMLGGSQVSDLVAFVNSWKVKDENSTCWDGCYGPCEPILPGVGAQYKNTESCGIISQLYGPFHMCHQIGDPEMFLKNCVNDMVRNGGNKKVLCEALSVYLAACQIQAIHVKEWRKKVGCEIECAGHSQYNPCGNPCPETCAGKLFSCHEQLPCMETCECNPGFVLHEGRCTLKKNCGHFCNGYYYAPGETFWGDNGCTQKCACDPESQKIKCWNSTCQAGEECGVSNGIKGCYPSSYSQCTTFGDQHYITFDNVQYDFHGTCRYQLIGLCDKSHGLTEFYVEIFNRHQGIRDVSYTRSVLVGVYGSEILLNRENPHRVMVNGVLLNLPYSLQEDQVQVFVQGWDAVILTKFDLKVTFDWDSRVTVTIPQSYSGAVCGLCGNFNGNMDDEMTMKNGEVSENISAFVESWRRTDKPEGCKEQESVSCPVIQSLERIQRKNLIECGIIVKNNGPFRDCHSLVNPEVYFKDCLLEFCFYYARQDIYCKVIEAYAAACQQVNGTVYEWRKYNFCKAWCPENSDYTLCSKGCANTCSSSNTPSRCDDFCRESCVCKDGFLLDGNQCVPMSNCGCVLNGIYYKTNETLYPTSSCHKKCVCQPGGLVMCSLFSCSPHEVCKIHNGVRKCHPTEVAMCSVTGGSHYYTFDGVSYNFQGNCTYVLTKACSWDIIPSSNFSVFLSVISPKKVAVFVNDIKIIITQGKSGTIQVNDVLFNLPLSLRDKGVWVFQHGVSVVLSTNFGLEVTYDLTSQVIVNISSNFHGKVCGLCGNYNGDATDDYQLPDGSQESDVTTFGETWKDDRLGLACRSKCQGDFCPPCEQRSVYEGKNSCGLLLVNEGLFSACHNRVDPQGYFNNCVLELCHGRGNTKVLCNNLQSYVTTCQNVGVTGIKWRSNSFCSLDCPPNSHYEVCADTCGTTCARIVAPTTCPGGCSEGCQCNDGYYLDRDKCVSFSKCGCYTEGRYYMLNETFLGDNCQQICTCRSGSGVTCRTYSCPRKTKCKRKLGRASMCETESDGSLHN